MDILQNLLARALVVMNEIKERQNTAMRIGSLFRDIIQYMQNIIMGIILKGSKENSAAIQATPGAQRGDTYLALDAGHYWTFDGTQWNDIGVIIPTDVAKMSDLENWTNEYNVTVKIPLPTGYYTPETARAAVPAPIRKRGLIITYETSAGIWKIEQYTGTFDLYNYEFENNLAWKTLSDIPQLPDVTTGRVDFVAVKRNLSINPLDAGRIETAYNLDSPGSLILQYPIIPGCIYDVSFYVKSATSARVSPKLFEYWFDSPSISVYNVPADLNEATLKNFQFTAAEKDKYLFLSIPENSILPTVTGAKSRYHRILDDGSAELKPASNAGLNTGAIHINTTFLANINNTYARRDSVIHIYTHNQGATTAYKLKKGKAYDLIVYGTTYYNNAILVVPKTDLEKIQSAPKETQIRLPNTKWEDVFWNEQSIYTFRPETGFKNYLCKEDDMYLLVSSNPDSMEQMRLTEHENTGFPKIFPHNDRNLQKYIPCQNLGRINIIGTLPTSKSQGAKRCDAEIRIGGHTMNTKVDVSVQGTSTAILPKKGFTLDILTPDGTASQKIQFGGWRAYDSYYTKAYMYDVTKTRDLLANRVFDQMKLTLPPGRQRNWERAGNTFQFPVGAIGHIDGIPFEMYNNGEYYGLHVMNIKKTRDNYMMDKANSDQIWLDVGGTFFDEPVNWGIIEIRNPGGFTEGAEPPAGSVKTAIQDFWMWFGGDWTNRTREEIESKIDIVAAIDVYILYMFILAWDGLHNNLFFSTYNGGGKWSYEIYDYNDTWGRYSCTHINQIRDALVFGSIPDQIPRSDFERIKVLYAEEIRYRWKMLVDAGVMTWENITGLMYHLFNQYGYDGIKKDLERWNLWTDDGVNVGGTVQMERYIKIACSSFNNGYDYYELNSPVIETDMFK